MKMNAFDGISKFLSKSNKIVICIDRFYQIINIRRKKNNVFINENSIRNIKKKMERFRSVISLLYLIYTPRL